MNCGPADGPAPRAGSADGCPHGRRAGLSAYKAFEIGYGIK